MTNKEIVEVGNKVAQFIQSKITERLADSLQLIAKDINSGLSIFVSELDKLMQANVEKVVEEVKEDSLNG